MDATTRYRFGELTLDVGRCQLSRGTETIAVSKLSLRLLRVLVEAAPNVVTHDELAERVWGPRRIVTPENVAKRVMILRKALEDDAQAPRYIAGVRGVGYRWIPEARVLAKEPAVLSTRLAHGLARGRAARYVAAGLILAVLGIIASVFWRPEPVRNTSGAAIARPDADRSRTEAGAVRIDVEVVDADTARVILRDSYDADLTAEDMLEIQRKIATSIEEVLGALVITRPPERGDSVREESERRQALCTSSQDVTFRDPITGELLIPMGSSLFPVQEPVTCLPVSP